GVGRSMSWLQAVAAMLVGVSIVLPTVELQRHDHEHAVLEHEHWLSQADGHRDHGHHDYGPEGSSAGDDASHSHRHRHRPLHHAHHHWPDLHHRHEHDQSSR